MSVKIMDRVWETSPHKGTPLLVLLALADWSNDRGECDPSYAQLAGKARINRRQAIRVVKRLVETGDIEVKTGAGFEFAKGVTSNRLVLTRYVGQTETAQADTGGPGVTSGLGVTRGSGLGVTRGSGLGVTRGSGLGVTHNGQLQHPTTTPNNNQDTPAPNDGAGATVADDATVGGAGALVTDEPPAKRKHQRKRAPAAPLGPGAVVYRDVFHLTPNVAQRELLDAACADLGPDDLRFYLTRWQAHGWKPTNVPGMVEFALARGQSRPPGPVNGQSPQAGRRGPVTSIPGVRL